MDSGRMGSSYEYLPKERDWWKAFTCTLGGETRLSWAFQNLCHADSNLVQSA